LLNAVYIGKQANKYLKKLVDGGSGASKARFFVLEYIDKMVNNEYKTNTMSISLYFTNTMHSIAKVINEREIRYFPYKS
jgi:hypothetical protein